ncbi:MAG: MerR family transcriptional regulator [Blastocatellia bacterium]
MKRADVELKSGQIAAILGIDPKQIQNTVEAGYVQPAAPSRGRGQLRLYSFENLVQFRVLHTLVQAYGLEKQRAAQMLAQAWPRPFSARVRTLTLAPVTMDRDHEVRLEPIRLPLREIAADTERRVALVLQNYEEKKRGRPAGWAREMRAAVNEVADHLQGVDDEAIHRAIAGARAVRRGGGGKTGKRK